MAEALRNGSARETDTDSRVSVLESQVTTINSNLEKIETKMDNNYAVLHSRISDLRDDLRNDFEKKNDGLLEKLEEHNQNSLESTNRLMEKISDIEKWRWMILGASVVVGYVLAHIKLERLF